MPHANIWIRRDNWEKWSALESKANFVNDALNNSADVAIIDHRRVVEDPLSRFKKGSCKIHGTPLTMEGKCLQKGCKYS